MNRSSPQQRRTTPTQAAGSPTIGSSSSPAFTSPAVAPSPPPPAQSPSPPPARTGSGKGKGRADAVAAGRPLVTQGTVESLASLLDDALSSPLDLTPETTPERPRPRRGQHLRGAGSMSNWRVPARLRDPRRAAVSVDLGDRSGDRLPRSPRTSFDPGRVSPLSPGLTPPPMAHRPSSPMRPSFRPRLVSNLTRSTLPTASLTYTYAEDHWHPDGWTTRPRAVVPSRHVVTEDTGVDTAAAGPSSARSPGGAAGGSRPRSVISYDENYTWSLARAFPDLDPDTGLPLEPASERRGSDPESSRLHIQRTISELSRYSHEPAGPSLALPLFGALPPLPTLPQLPQLPPLPSMPSMLRGSRSSVELGDSGRRNFSTSAGVQKADWTNWASTFWTGNKTSVDGMLSDDDQADTVEEEQQKHAIKYRTPQYPMVFCHGLMGFDYLGPDAIPALQINHWRGIREVLEANGVEVMICRVPATSSIKDRALILQKLIAEKYSGRTINLVAHSMGGLDCRYLISALRPTEFSIASLTTISTPHRGSPFADYVIDNVIGADRLPQLLGVMEAMQIPNSGDGNAFSALRTSAMAQFNADVVDDPNVKYYSWGASFEPGLFDTFRWPHSVIMAKEGPNDGMVSVHSARWGEYRGTLLDVNHLDLVGWVNSVRYMFSGWTGKPISFKPATFYLEISDYLAQRDF